MILVLIALAVAVRDMTPFTRNEAVGIWRSIHGLGMGIGTGAVLVGFLAGVMYLVKSSRLKRKRAGSVLRLADARITRPTEPSVLIDQYDGRRDRRDCRRGHELEPMGSRRMD